MGFSIDNGLDSPATGQSGWDGLLNGNFQILERGYHFYGVAGTSIGSGQVCTLVNSGYVFPFNATSLGIKIAHCIAYRNCNSGEAVTFLARGVVRSMAIWSGGINPGEPVFVSAASLGWITKSYYAPPRAVGLCIAPDAIYFSPNEFDPVPEEVTVSASLGPVLVGSWADFSLPLMHRGMIKNIQLNAQSSDAYKLQLWTSSDRASSHLAYETLTQSWSVASSDIHSTSFTDAAGLPFKNSDTASWALMFGRVTVQSGSTVNSSNFSITIIGERFR